MAHEELSASIAPGAFSPPPRDPFDPWGSGPARDPFAPEARPHAADPPHSGEAAYLLIQSTGPVDPSECEQAGLEAVEVTVLWGTSVLTVAHLAPPRPYYVGHGEGAVVDYLLPHELCPAARAPIVAIEGGNARPIAPEGAALAGNDVSFGALTFRVKSVTAGKRTPRAVGADARGLGSAFVVSLASVAAFMGALAYYTPALGASLDDELDRDRIDTMRLYLQAEAEREREKHQEEAGKADTEQGGGNPGEAAKGPEGKMGRPNVPSVQKRTAIAGHAEAQLLPREVALREATTFGIVQVIQGMNARALPTPLWGADVPNGPDASDAWGELFGKDPGESGGLGGLGISGTGLGGGGYGEGIGIGRIGTCGTNCGMGPGKGGWGSGWGGTGRGHPTKAPTLRTATTTVSGHLPAEVIQRVVRQNFGRFRMCYEQGLGRNPNLTGRVGARFVIGRDGAVTNVANGGSDLPDSGVVSCVISAFYGLSFPSPELGIVTVTYPIMFSPGG